MSRGRILSLCDYSGVWSAPYAAAGYDVVRVDLQAGQDVRLLEWCGPVRGVLAAPPCTLFSKAGAWTWPTRPATDLPEALAVVDACLRIVVAHRPAWWALENPPGRLSRWLGPPAFSFQPWHYGDPWTKLTHLWGHFTPPPRRPVRLAPAGRADARRRDDAEVRQGPKRQEPDAARLRARLLRGQPMKAKPPKLPPLSEKQFLAHVVQLARLCGWLVYHTHDSRRSAEGYPDLTLVHAAWGLLFAELKADRGRVRPEQADWLAALRSAGQRAYLWRPADWEQIVSVLRGQGGP